MRGVSPLSATAAELADRLEDALPQTQCTRCGEPDCRRYAEAIAAGEVPINRCPPGGHAGIVRLAAITRQPVQALDPAHGAEGPRALAVIDEAWCIGCTLCIKACPVDAIVGAAKRMHTVIDGHCTGCELCIPVCPVDCIVMEPATGTATGWAAWSPEQAAVARARYAARGIRLERESRENDARLAARRRARQLGLQATEATPDGPEAE
jgi:electron transport complex protein RnfB